MSYTQKVDQLLKVATELSFTEADFADLALAAADQSGVTVAEQASIDSALGIRYFPPDWPRCPSCGDHAIAAHATCGRIECGEAQHR